jgi:hypothetical protein
LSNRGARIELLAANPDEPVAERAARPVASQAAHLGDLGPRPPKRDQEPFGDERVRR